MPLTNFPYGVSSFGVPVLPSGVPVGKDSKVYYVDSVYGNDGMPGDSPANAMKTIEAAYAKLRSGYYDGIFMIGLGTAFTLASAVTWSKDYTFLVGLSAPTGQWSRARITNGLSTNLMTPMVTFTATGVIVKNVLFFQGGDHATSAAVCVYLNGAQRCYFEDCHFAGGGQTSSRGNAAMRSLVLDGGPAGAGQGENLFRHCTFGIDTVASGNVAGIELEAKNFATRNVFEDCMFQKSGAASQLFLSVGASGLQRFLLFRRCTFINTGTALDNCMSVNAAPNGVVILDDCMAIGCTAVPASANVKVRPETATTTAVFLGVSPT